MLRIPAGSGIRSEGTEASDATEGSLLLEESRTGSFGFLRTVLPDVVGFTAGVGLESLLLDDDDDDDDDVEEEEDDDEEDWAGRFDFAFPDTGFAGFDDTELELEAAEDDDDELLLLDDDDADRFFFPLDAPSCAVLRDLTASRRLDCTRRRFRLFSASKVAK